MNSRTTPSRRRHPGRAVRVLSLAALAVVALVPAVAGADAGLTGDTGLASAVTAAPTDRGADLTWSAPAGTAVQNYSIAVTDLDNRDAFSVITHGDYETVHLSDLINGDTYSVVVTGQPGGTAVGSTTVVPRATPAATPPAPVVSVSPIRLASGAAGLRLRLAPSPAGAGVDYVTAFANSTARVTLARDLAAARSDGETLTLGPLQPKTRYNVGAVAHSAQGFGPVAWTTITTGDSACPADACLTLRPSSTRFSPRVNGILNDVGSRSSATRAIGSTHPAFVRANVGYGSAPGIAGKVRAMGAALVQNLADAWYARTDSGRAGGAMPPWECWTCYAQFIRSQVSTIEANGVKPQYWEVENEPGADGTYPAHLDGDAGLYLKQLEIAATAIHDVDPSARVLGPTSGSLGLGSTTRLDETYLPLDLVLANASRIPGFAGMDWHEISPTLAPAAAADDVRMARQVAALAGVRGLATVVSEYTTPYDATLAGAAATWMGWLTQAGVTQASRACWTDQPGQGSAASTCQGMADGLLTSVARLTGPGEVAAFYGGLGHGKASLVDVTSSSPYVSAVAARQRDGLIRIIVGHEASCLPRVNLACPGGTASSPGALTVRLSLPARGGSVQQARTVSAAPGVSLQRAGTARLSSRSRQLVVTTTVPDGAAGEITLVARDVTKTTATKHRHPAKHHHRHHRKHHRHG